MDVFTALVVKEVLLEVVAEGEEWAALEAAKKCQLVTERTRSVLLTASLLAKFLPSGQATRRVRAAYAPENDAATVEKAISLMKDIVE